jgi:phage terminase large subunit-like protein
VQVLHPAREPLEVLSSIRATLGEHNFASQYQQSPAPLEGGLVKSRWFKTYSDTDLPEQFDQILQSWDTANKPNQLADYSVCTAWGIKKKNIYLLHVFRKRIPEPSSVDF